MDLINNIVSMYLLGIDNNKKYIETHYNNITKKKHNNNILWNREFGEVDINNIREQELTHQLDTVLNGYNKIANKSAYLAPYGALNSTTNHKNQNSDSLPEDILEILDPTGISSWDDVYRAGKEFANNPNWMTGLSAGVEAAGAIPVLGNHEFWPLSKEHGKRELSIQWRPQFTLPVENSLSKKLHETVYTVDYQNIRIIVLNSNYNLREQTKYIEQKLKTSKAKWNIVTCHHSVFSPAKGRDFEYGREHWKPLFDKYNAL